MHQIPNSSTSVPFIQEKHLLFLLWNMHFASEGNHILLLSQLLRRRKKTQKEPLTLPLSLPKRFRRKNLLQEGNLSTVTLALDRGLQAGTC